jgi:hypothetical protein
MMFLYEDGELFGILLKTGAIVFFLGIMILSLVPARLKSVVSVGLDLVMSLITSILALKSFRLAGLKSEPVKVSLIMFLPQYIIILAIFIGTVLNSWN